MQPGGVSNIKKGDYLVVTPENPNNIDDKYIAALESEYDLLFSTKSPFAIPSMNAKAIVKKLVVSFLGKEESARLLHLLNIMQWPDYYVFIKR
jgi:intein/homing endonuclease